MAFAIAAGVVWFAGTNISRYAKVISDRTGINTAFLGLMLLGGISSLPEVAATTTSSWTGDAALAVNNLLGSVAMNVTILAMADAAIGRDAISAIVGRPGMLLQATLNIMLLVAVIAGISVGDLKFVGIGAWSWAIFVLYLGAVWLNKGYQSRTPWRPDGREGRRQEGGTGRTLGSGVKSQDREPDIDGASLNRTIVYTAVAAAAILVAGYVLSKAGNAIAEQTGLGASFVGVALLAISTSLPEISTVLSAVRIRQYAMAFSDIFGSNLFNVALVFVNDAVYLGGAVLNEVGRFASFAALLGIALTSIYIAGLLERRDRTVFRIGIDSLAVVAVYLGGLALLYRLR